MALKTVFAAAILIFSQFCWCYKYESLLNPQQTEVSSNENGEYYSEAYEYHRWNTNRNENGTFKIINVRPVHKHHAGAVQEAPKSKVGEANVVSQTYDGIVFPETPVRHNARNFAPKIPEDCLNSTLCTNVPNYPEDYIDNLLSNSAEVWHETVDKLAEEEVKINQRIGEDPDEFELCRSFETVVYPKAAENSNRKWISIVNTKRYVQGFRVEKCANPKAPCDKVAVFQAGLISTCKQKFVLREMKAIDDSGNIYVDQFRLPSCCSCVYRYALS